MHEHVSRNHRLRLLYSRKFLLFCPRVRECDSHGRLDAMRPSPCASRRAASAAVEPAWNLALNI
eukprot:COSAG02_NODE_43464_length_374_cov_1.298182_1_plen_63_part_01